MGATTILRRANSLPRITAGGSLHLSLPKPGREAESSFQILIATRCE